jgi:hypothetical protein
MSGDNPLRHECDSLTPPNGKGPGLTGHHKVSRGLLTQVPPSMSLLVPSGRVVFDPVTPDSVAPVGLAGQICTSEVGVGQVGLVAQ